MDTDPKTAEEYLGAIMRIVGSQTSDVAPVRAPFKGAKEAIKAKFKGSTPSATHFFQHNRISLVAVSPVELVREVTRMMPRVTHSSEVQLIYRYLDLAYWTHNKISFGTLFGGDATTHGKCPVCDTPLDGSTIPVELRQPKEPPFWNLADPQHVTDVHGKDIVVLSCPHCGVMWRSSDQTRYIGGAENAKMKPVSSSRSTLVAA